MQDEDGQIEEPYSISAGLDYPGVGPLHAWLAKSGRARCLLPQMRKPFRLLCCAPGRRGLFRHWKPPMPWQSWRKLSFTEDVVVVNLSGRGDKDMETYIDKLDI